jgi:Isoprenylcysteine carboxyl methyltransferase (ICMT) family
VTLAAGLLLGAVKNAGPWEFGSTGLSAIGLLVMWTGLAVRIWAIVVLGNSFRMTVEVDTSQRIVDSGPYRWVRHPSGHAPRRPRLTSQDKAVDIGAENYAKTLITARKV